MVERHSEINPAHPIVEILQQLTGTGKTRAVKDPVALLLKGLLLLSGFSHVDPWKNSNHDHNWPGH